MSQYDWPSASQRRLIGKDISRVDGPSKASGGYIYLRREPTGHAFTKLREAQHDADLYSAAPAGTRRDCRGGVRNFQVIVDSELKKNLDRDLEREEREGHPGDAKTEIAEPHGLRVA